MGGGVELHTGFDGAEPVSRLATIDASGMNFLNVPLIAVHRPAISSEPGMPLLSIRNSEGKIERVESSDST